MKKFFNLMLVIALAIGFVSCEKELSDGDYQNKLIGKWSMTSLNTTVSAMGYSESSSMTFPNEDCDAMILEFKQDGTLVTTAIYDGEPVVSTDKYHVSGGNLIIGSTYDGEEETYSMAITSITNKNMTLQMNQSSTEDGVSATLAVTMNLAKL